jgi:hypothetical protein
MIELAPCEGALPSIDIGAYAEAVALLGESCKSVAGGAADCGAACSQCRTKRIAAFRLRA